jgi:hypothetical protein
VNTYLAVMTPDEPGGDTSDVPALLPMMALAARRQPATGLGYDLVGPTHSIRLRRTADAWTTEGDGAAPTSVISGDDSALMLFVMGRIPVAHPSLTITGDSAAAAFKEYFPGP